MKRRLSVFIQDMSPEVQAPVVFALKFLADVGLWLLAAPLAFWLRVEHLAPYIRAVGFYTLMGVPLKAGLVWFTGLHRQSWRRASLWDLSRLAWTVGLYGSVTLTLVWLWRKFALHVLLILPRSVPLIEMALSLLLLGGVRFGVRWMHEVLDRRRKPSTKRRILLVGAGEAGTMLVREMQRHPEYGLPVAFLDDDKAKQGTTVLGVPVVGPLADLPKVVQAERVDEVLIAMPTAPGRVIRQVVELCQQANVPSRTIPALHEILGGKVLIQQARPIQVEDLLRREPVQLDLEGIAAYLTGKRILVTGAGGSIGSEIVRQVIRFHPQMLVLLGRGENSLYELAKELRFRWPELPFRLVVADIRDEAHIHRIFARWRPQIVFHAAAHKHVPLMELQPDEAVRNNVFGTWNVVRAAQEREVERLVNISTDKAVNPTSVMGATKRVAEYIVQVAAAQARPGQSFVSVRFGNVLGSRGSVVRLFQEQIRRGGPVTITHPEMRRYFMTISEATQLVLQAGGLGENGAVYVLDMGEPVKIVELARDLIHLSGFDEEEIPIKIIGMRPGEKLFEELLTAEEGTMATRHEKIFAARVPPVKAEWLQDYLQRLQDAAWAGDAHRIRALLQEMIPSYRPFEPSESEENPVLPLGGEK